MLYNYATYTRSINLTNIDHWTSLKSYDDTSYSHIVLVVLNKGLVSSDAEYSITYGNKTISNLVAPANSLQTLIWNA